MNNDLISIIMPVYKVENYIRKSIESVINQTYKNIELIIVDDGSPDNCGRIADIYAKKDNRIKVIHQKNGGLSHARNEGIKKATGKYIGFIDSDDYADNDMYEYLYKLITDNNADISICGFRTFGNAGKYDKTVPEDMILSNVEALNYLCEDSVIQSYAWNKLYKRELFTDYNIEYPVGKTMEDVATTYKLFFYSNKIVVGNKICYNYLQRSNSILTSKSIEPCINYIEFLFERLFFMHHNNLDLKISYRKLFDVITKFYVKNIKELNEYMDAEKIDKKLIDVGNNYSLIKTLSKKDRIKLLLFRFNKRIYIYSIKLVRKLIIFKEGKHRKYIKNEFKKLIEIIKSNENQKKAFIFLACDYGNMGDIAITYSQSDFLKNFLNDYEVIEVRHIFKKKELKKIKKFVNKDDIITIVGGGNMGNVYHGIEERRQIINQLFKSKTIISFPQTITIDNDESSEKFKDKLINNYSSNPNFIMCAREKQSYETMKNLLPKNKTILVPDIVFYLEKRIGIDSCKDNVIGICYRDDSEKIDIENIKANLISRVLNENLFYFDTHIGDINLDYENRYSQLMDLINNISKMKLLITDRLHGMILAYIVGTPCIVFDNSTHKIKSTYETWLKESNIVKFVEKEEDLNFDINEFINNSKDYKRINLEEKFIELENIIKKEGNKNE